MREEEYESLSGSVGSVIYQNEDNGYTVLRLDMEDGSEATVVGCIPSAVPGEKLEVFGSWGNHPQHGAQFKAMYSQRSLPDTEAGIYSYLASGAIKGIGPATATLLLTRFGVSTLDVIETEPEKLAELRGISRKKAMQLSEDLRRQLGLRRLMEFLSANELRPLLALRLYQIYGDKAYTMVRENPYILAHEQIGAGFDEADRLALSIGFEADSPQRVAAAILHELSYNSAQGHVFIPREKLVAVTAQLLDADTDTVSVQLDTLLERGDVVEESIAGVNACYLSMLYEAETNTAARLLDMCKTKYAPGRMLDERIKAIEEQGHLSFAPMQLTAIRTAALHQVMVLTGGPGTGKTTCVRAILKLFESMELTTLLAAPTGRAAKRLEELSGREAKTIHRLLEAYASPDGTKTVFRRNAKEPLRCDALILDEVSMVDISLMSALLEALPADCRLVLVGDADQLPSVGPGRVFPDIIRSGVVETVCLTEIFRQAAGSNIVQAAHTVNHGEMPDLTQKTGDFFFLRRRNPDAAVDTIVELCAKRLPERMHIPVRELQVLSPTRKGAYGTAHLNRRLQAALNPPAEDKKEHPYGDLVFREGDRVMQIKNDYDILWYKLSGDVREEALPSTLWDEEELPPEIAVRTECGLGIFNGDVGYILRISSEEQAMIVDFDGRQAKYSFELLSELEHAWATTVHKSQGSEYRGVVLAMLPAAPRLMTRGVLYTAITRARELLVTVGEDECFAQMVSNQKIERRYSGLRARLCAETV